jgi:competence protein ComEA
MINIIKSKKVFVIGGLILVLLIGSFLIFSHEDKDEVIAYNIDSTTNITTSVNKIHVDVKGNVKKPGVYEVDEGSIVLDAINKAGGLKSNSYTKNINLAMKLKDEMVIYVYKSSEVNKTTTKVLNDVTCTTNIIKVDEPTTSSNSSTSSLVNINTASIDELLTVTGIGESKAKAIVEYRSSTPFKTIEDIMNVTGIGESLFAKIKDYITV